MAFDIEHVRSLLPYRIEYYPTLDSTMIVAARLAGEGCPPYTAVVAGEQTAGQGRLGRTWHSEADSGLYCSIVLRLGLAAESMPVLTLALGIAAAEAIRASAGLACDLRWPNDVLIRSRKAGGILVQLYDTCAVAGIGINVNQTSFAPELEEQATSLRLEMGVAQSREALLLCLLPAVERHARMLVEQGRAAVIERFSRISSFASGRRVRVDQAEGALLGTTAGLDGQGFLIVRRDDGSDALVLAGGVRPV